MCTYYYKANININKTVATSATKFVCPDGGTALI